MPLGRDALAAAFIFIALLSTYYRHDAPLDVTKSGRLAVYGTDLVGIAVIVVMAYVMLRHPEARAAHTRRYLWLLATFLAYCAMVSGIRFATGSSDLQSLLIPRANALTVWILLAVLIFRIRRRPILVAVSAFAAVLAVATLAMSMTRAAYTFDYWQSHVIRADILAMLLPLNILAVITTREGRLRWVVRASLGLHLFATMYATVTSGSRLNALLFPAVAFLALIWLGRALGSRMALIFSFCLLLALPALYVTQGCSGVVKYGVIRAPFFNALLNSHREPNNDHCWLGSDSRIGAGGAASDALTSATTSGPAVSQASKGAASGPALASSSTTTPTTASLPTSSPTPSPSKSPAPLDERVPDPELSKRESTAARGVVWRLALKDVRSNPVFGPGYRQYEIRYSGSQDAVPVVVPPHNFILENALAYGVVGLILWLSLLAVPTFIAIRRTPLAPGAVLPLLALAYALGAASFQPLMVNPTILFFCFLTVSVAVLETSRARPSCPEAGARP